MAEPGSLGKFTFRNGLVFGASFIPPKTISSPLASTNEYKISVGGAFGWTAHWYQLKVITYEIRQLRTYHAV